MPPATITPSPSVPSDSTTTIWLAITTAYPSRDGCDTEIWRPSGGRIYAWDPYYDSVIRPVATGCLPREQWLSYWQSTMSNPGTTTLLGPTFVCPEAYNGVLTSSIDSFTQQTFCCPKSFTLSAIATEGGWPNPIQCTSSITSGQTITYMTGTGTLALGWSTTVVAPGPTTVLGVHINGFNVRATPESSISSLPTSSATSSSPSSSSAAAASATTTSSSTPNSISAGAAAGIAIGAIAVLALVATGAFILIRMRRRRKIGQSVPTTDPDDENTANNPPEPGAQQHVVHEMAMKSKRPENVNMTELGAETPRYELNG